jgi:hypothetical protein
VSDFYEFWGVFSEKVRDGGSNGMQKVKNLSAGKAPNGRTATLPLPLPQPFL